MIFAFTESGIPKSKSAEIGLRVEHLIISDVIEAARKLPKKSHAAWAELLCKISDFDITERHQ